MNINKCCPPVKTGGKTTEDGIKEDRTREYLRFLVENGAFLVPLPKYPFGEGVSPNAPLVKWSKLEQKPSWAKIEEWQKITNRFAIVCGERSDGIVGIDIDNYETFTGMALGPLTGQTWTEHRDYKKFHILVKSTKPVHTRNLRIDGQEGEDVSIRGDGTIITCGYSPHPKGGCYEHYMQSPETIKTFESGFFEDFVAIWQNFRGIEPKKKSFRRLPDSIFTGSLIEIVKQCVKEDGKELEDFTDDGECYRCRCPFPNHPNRTTPAFVVYKESQTFYCFGCQKSGNAVAFVKEYCKISWKDAKKRLTEQGYIREEKDKGEINILDEVERALEDAEKESYNGPINFDSELGIFLTVPINTRIPENSNNPFVYSQPIFSTTLAQLPQQTEDKEIEKDNFGAFPHENWINGVFPQVCRPIEGVEIYLSSRLRVEILQSYRALLKTGEIVWKIDSEEISRLPAIKHISYFKMNYDIESYIVACWAIGTYLFPMFPVYPYLIFVGEKGTNKSGQLTFLSRVCWNPTNKLAIPNEAPMFRLIQQAKPTMLIDEAHRQLNHPIYGPMLYTVLETGHEQGGRVPRCDENDKNRINFYKTYCPKALASRQELELEEKAITIVLSKNYNKKYAIARKILETTPDLDITQKKLLHYALLKWQDVLNAYNEIEPTDRLAGRYFLLWAPILAICKVTYPEKYNELLKYAEEAVMGAEKKSYEVEIRILSFLASRLDFLKQKGNAIYLKDLAEPLNLKWQPIFSGLRNLSLIKRDVETGEGKKYYLDIPRIKKLAEERNITIEETTACDRCGFNRSTTQYKGELLCEDCLNEALEKEKPEFLTEFDEEEE